MVLHGEGLRRRPIVKVRFCIFRSRTTRKKAIQNLEGDNGFWVKKKISKVVHNQNHDIGGTISQRVDINYS